MSQKKVTRRHIVAGLLCAPLGVFLASCVSSSNNTNNTEQVNNTTTRPSERTCVVTKEDIEGPFYTANPPTRISLIDENTKGKPISISGAILDAADCTTGLAGYIIDLWHADHDGEYDNKGFKLRGQLATDEKGQYAFETIRPGRYPDRPFEHIHVKIRDPQGTELLNTQIYFDDDPKLPRKQVSGPIIVMKGNTGTLDFVLKV